MPFSLMPFLYRHLDFNNLPSVGKQLEVFGDVDVDVDVDMDVGVGVGVGVSVGVGVGVHNRNPNHWSNFNDIWNN